MEAQQDKNANSLYVGNLDSSRVTEQMLVDIFKNGLPHMKEKVLTAKMFIPQDVVASITVAVSYAVTSKCYSSSAKNVLDNAISDFACFGSLVKVGTDAYCFVTFADHDSAMAGLSFLNGREVFGKKVKVNWASSGTQSKPQGAQKYIGSCSSIFVGDLDPDVNEDTLRKAFDPCGDIVSVRVVKDAVTNQSKGYGFVSFKSKIDAEHAMTKMQGATLGGKAIRTNWATRNKVPGAGDQQRSPPLNYNEVYRAASDNNTTVYVANLPNSISDEKLRQTFNSYGQIQDTRIFMDKLYCFIKYGTHESAATAIVKCNGMDIDGSYIKCWWGKESSDQAGGSLGGQGQGQAAYSMYNQSQYAAMYYNYWYNMAQQQQQMQGQGQSGQQQVNPQNYMQMVQGQGYPMYNMYPPGQYGTVMQGYGGSGQQQSGQNGAQTSSYGAPYQNSH
eukprot:gene5579-6268_t